LSDQQAVTFHLREDVEWHDGHPFTADDVAFTFELMLHPEYRGLDNSSLLLIEGAEEYRNGDAESVTGIEVIDEHTITIRLTKSFGPTFTTLASTYILPGHRFQAYPVTLMRDIKPTLSPVGTGPFRFVDYEKNEQLVLDRNDEWWGPAPRIGRLVWKVINPEEAPGLMAQGVIDALGVGAASALTPDLLARLQEAAIPEGEVAELEALELDIWGQPGFLYDYLFFNLTDPRFQDVRLRRAFAHAVDRERIVDKLMGGHATLVDGPLLPFSWGCPDDGAPYEHDSAKARELLETAGWRDLDGDGILENRNGESLRLTLTYPVGDALRAASVPYIQEDLQEVGVSITRDDVEYNELIRHVVQNPDYELGLLGWQLGRDPDQRAIWSAGAVFNLARFENDEAEFMLEEGAHSSLNPEARRSFYEEWYRLIRKEAPYVFLYARNNIYVFNSATVQGYDKSELNPLDSVHEWYVVGEQEK